MALLRRLYSALNLTGNEAKSALCTACAAANFWATASRWDRTGAVKRKVAAKPLATFKQRVRQLTRRSGERSLQQVVERLRPYLRGWKAYFGLAQTPSVWRELDEWLRHRLRAIQLRQWRRGTTIYRVLRTLGAAHGAARQVTANSCRWWRNSAMLLNSVLTIAWFNRPGLPRLS